ncbi:MAG: ABC transporter substrate-binding protein [Rhodospirillaceae bacterium]|nr:ABC transporter substrate-binding protein [Rhodospirillaceae bacterium]
MSLFFRSVPLFAAAVAVSLAAQPAAAKTLRVGGTQAPPTLGNPYSAVGPPASTTWSAMFDALTYLDAKGDVLPALALSWENTSPRTWVFKLRPGVKFQNGTDFAADDVIAVLDYLKSPDGARWLVAGELRIIESYRSVDPMTVEITTVAPDAILPKRMNIIMIVEPGAWKTLGPDGFGLTPVGTGPFILKDWGRSSGRGVMEPFKDSWRAPKQVTRLELVNILDTAARTQALMADQIDVAVGLNPEDGALLDGNGFRAQYEPSAVVMSIAFRTERADTAPLKDKRVRQALNYAVDKEGIVTTILAGTTRVASQGATPETYGYNPDLKPYPYDPAKAKALLAEAGYPNGFPLKIEVLTNLGMSDTTVYQKMAEDLGKIGVAVELRPNTFAGWLRHYMSGEWDDIDAFSLTWNSAPFQDVIRPIEYFSCMKTAKFFCDPEMVPLIEASNREMDPDQRQAKLREIMARMYDAAPALWLVDFSNLLIVSDRLENVYTRPAGIVFEEIEFKK